MNCGCWQNKDLKKFQEVGTQAFILGFLNEFSQKVGLVFLDVAV